MLDLKKYQADIEDESSRKGMTIELWAADESQAKEKLNWLVQFPKSWKKLQSINTEE